MKIVGLTGGIGSGKTTVSKMFSNLDISVYIADIEAKKIINSSKIIRKELIFILGKDTFLMGTLNRKYVADLIFNDIELLEKVNKIIHPRVAKHFLKWCKKQKSPYVIKEAAILFENGGYKNCDATILITAPKKVRIDRVLKREVISEKEIKARIKNQWCDNKKKELADFVIENIDLNTTKDKVKKIHLFLLKNLN